MLSLFRVIADGEAGLDGMGCRAARANRIYAARSAPADEIPIGSSARRNQYPGLSSLRRRRVAAYARTARQIPGGRRIWRRFRRGPLRFPGRPERGDAGMDTRIS